MCYIFLSHKVQGNLTNRVKFAIFLLIFKFVWNLEDLLEFEPIWKLEKQLK
jgi:hypothetical protein